MTPTLIDPDAASSSAPTADAPVHFAGDGRAPAAQPRSWQARWANAAFPWAMIVLGAVIAFHPLILHPREVLVGPQHDGNNDLTAYFLVPRLVAATSLERNGELPLWNPGLLCGTPYAGNPQSAWLYPPNWIYLWLNDRAVATGWVMALHLLWAAVGIYLLCRHWGLERFSASAGASLGACAPYWLAHVGEGHYNQICAVAWIPWGILAYERLRKGKPCAVALTAGTLAMSFFAGHAQETFYLALTLTAAVVFDLAVFLWRREGTQAARLAGRWLLVGAATLGLTAVDLGPIAIYSRMSVRGAGMSVADAGIGLTAANLRQLVWPWALGSPANPQPPHWYFWENVCYFGVVPLALAGFAACTAFRQRGVRWSAGLFVAALAFAFGASGPFFHLLYVTVPGVSLFRAPSRALFFCAVAVSILAAVGIDRLIKKSSGQVHDTGKWTNWRHALAVALWLLCLLELGSFAHHVLRAVPSPVSNNPELLAFPAVGRNERALAEQRLLSDREALELGIQKVQAYEPAPLAHYCAAIAAMSRNGDPTTVLLGFDPLDLAALHKPVVDLLGIRYAVISSSQAPAAGWRLVGRGQRDAEFTLQPQPPQRTYSIWENSTPLPRAFVVGQARLPTADASEASVLQQIDPRQEVLLDADVLPQGRRSDFRPARLVRQTPSNVVVEAELDAPGYLVLTDVWYPGWRVFVDGRPAPILRANVAFRAVALAPGKHRVEWRYQTRGLFLGALQSGFTMLMLALSAALSFKCARLVGAQNDAQFQP